MNLKVGLLLMSGNDYTECPKAQIWSKRSLSQIEVFGRAKMCQTTVRHEYNTAQERAAIIPPRLRLGYTFYPKKW